MKKIKFQPVILIGICMNIFGAYAQNKADTIYTKINNQIVNKNEAVYFEIIQALDSGFFKFKTYLVKNNYLISKGKYSKLNPNYIEGKCNYYYPKTGLVRAIGNFIDNKLNGEYINYDSIGRLKSKRIYVNNDVEGDEYIYDSVGRVDYLLKYTKSRLNGICTSYYDNGHIRRIENFEYGKFIDGKYFTLKGEDTTFFRHNIQAKFAKGSFQDYLDLNFDDKQIKNESGTVEVQFLVLEDGSIDTTSIKILEGEELTFLSKEAIRLVKNQPKYIPAEFEGIKLKTLCKVNVSYSSVDE